MPKARRAFDRKTRGRVFHGVFHGVFCVVFYGVFYGSSAFPARETKEEADGHDADGSLRGRRTSLKDVFFCSGPAAQKKSRSPKASAGGRTPRVLPREERESSFGVGLEVVGGHVGEGGPESRANFLEHKGLPVDLLSFQDAADR